MGKRAVPHSVFTKEDGPQLCLCCRGVNHPEDLFDVPLGSTDGKGEN